VSALPVEPASDGVRIFIRLQPRARRAAIKGIVTEADGRASPSKWR